MPYGLARAGAWWERDVWRRASRLLSVAVIPLWSGCASVLQSIARPSARVDAVRLQDIGLQGLEMVVDVEVTNPASLPLPLLNVAYDLSSRGTSFVSGKAPLQGTVPAAGSKVVSLPIRVAFGPLLNVASDIRPGAVVPFAARLTLAVDAPLMGLLELPLERTSELPIPAVPGLALERIQWTELSLQRATAVLHLRLTNRNAFPIDVQRLDTALRLAGRPIVTAAADATTGLEPGAVGAIRIPVTFAPASLGTSVYSVLTGSRASYDLRGTLDLGSRFGPMSLPVEASGDVPLGR